MKIRIKKARVVPKELRSHLKAPAVLVIILSIFLQPEERPWALEEVSIMISFSSFFPKKARRYGFYRDESKGEAKISLLKTDHLSGVNLAPILARKKLKGNEKKNRCAFNRQHLSLDGSINFH